MKTLFFIMCAALMLTVGVAGAASTIIDSAENTVYTISGNPSVALASVPGSEGANALQINYQFVFDGALTGDPVVTKTFTTPIDVSAMEALTLDLNVPAASDLMLCVELTDDVGAVASANFMDAFANATAGYQTFSRPLSSFLKNERKHSGNAANMRKIKSVGYNMANKFGQHNGTVVFSIDNVRLVHSLGLLHETILEDFESYADTTALNAAYPTSGEATGVTNELETANPLTGAKALRLTGTFPSGGDSIFAGATLTLPAPLDLSTAKYFKLSSHGSSDMAGCYPRVNMTLIDGAGNRFLAWNGEWTDKSEWVTLYMPFAIPDSGFHHSCWLEDPTDIGGLDGNCDMTNIVAIRLSFQLSTATNPLTASVLFDNIIVGYAGLPAGVDDWALY